MELLAEQIVERGRKREALLSLEGERGAMLVARQRREHVAMTFGQLGKINRFRRIDALKGRDR